MAIKFFNARKDVLKHETRNELHKKVASTGVRLNNYVDVDSQVKKIFY